MASLRKRYQSHVESPDRDGPPVQSPPTTAAQPPEPATDTTPIEPMATESPAAVAASSAIRDRIREMNEAENLVQHQMEAVQQAVAHQQRLATEPQPTTEQFIATLQVPDRVKDWLRSHPQYVTDAAKAAELMTLHAGAQRQLGSQEFDDRYFERIEDLLGIKSTQPAQSGNGHVAERPAAPPPAPTPRSPVPQLRQRQQYSAPVAAPVSRESPSMSSGRVPSDVRLSADEVEI